uniref:Transforming growth factor, alpha n=1 Tax=Pundamilia nyererei TaxID=303518 RepID=A0A3B4G596_9CICH
SHPFSGCLTLLLLLGALTPTLCLISTEFVAAAVRSHFDDCPDSHRHFCFHGTCRFLILEETPACVCHPGFIGMRCEHADLLAVVATNHRQQTIATMLVLCVIGCVLIMMCSIRPHWLFVLVLLFQKPLINWDLSQTSIFRVYRE